MENHGNILNVWKTPRKLSENMDSYGRFHKWGYSNSWIVYTGKSYDTHMLGNLYVYIYIYTYIYIYAGHGSHGFQSVFQSFFPSQSR